MTLAIQYFDSQSGEYAAIPGEDHDCTLEATLAMHEIAQDLEVVDLRVVNQLGQVVARLYLERVA